MKARKLVLIIANLVLLAIVITQCVFLSRDGGKNFDLKETPDEIIIQSGDNNIVLKLEDDKWLIGDKKYPSNMATIDTLVDSLSSIRCLEKVASITKPGAMEKYELVEGKKVSVTARKEGKDLRFIEIGKNANTGSQAFITVDGGKDIYLATGNLRTNFKTTEDALRSKVIWDFDSSEITSVGIERPGETTFSVSKTGSGEDLQWIVNGSDIELDSGKAQSWFDSLGTLTTGIWYDETKDLGGKKIATVKITHGYDITSIDIFELPPKGEETLPSYYGKCSETPYPFELTSYTMEKINKNPEELAK